MRNKFYYLLATLVFSSFLLAQTYYQTTAFGDGSTETVYHSATDSEGNIFATGLYAGLLEVGTTVNSINNSVDAYITKHAADGTPIWVKSLGGTQTDVSVDVDVDESGNIYLTGYFQGAGSASFDADPGPGTYYLSQIAPILSRDAFIVKLDNDGNFIWAKQISNPAGGAMNEDTQAIKVDSEGNVFVVGNFIYADFDPSPTEEHIILTQDGENRNDGFLLKLNSEGEFQWVKVFEATDTSSVESIEFDADGNILLGGIFRETIDLDPSTGTDTYTSLGNYDGFVTKLDSEGNYIWGKVYGGTGLESVYRLLNQNGTIYVGGGFGATVDFDPGTGEANLTAGGITDGYVLALNSSGGYINAFSLGGTSTEIQKVSDITSYNGNELLVTGSFAGTTDFNASSTEEVTSTSAGKLDTYILNVQEDGTYLNHFTFGGSQKEDNAVARVTKNNDIVTHGMFKSSDGDFNPFDEVGGVPSGFPKGDSDIYVTTFNFDPCSTTLSVPYFEDFSNGEPDCWAYINSDNKNPVWAYNEAQDINGDGTNDPVMLIMPQSGSQNDKDDWLYTHKIQLEAGQKYKVEVRYNTFNIGTFVANEMFDLVVSDEQSADANFMQILGSYDNIMQQGELGDNTGNDLETMAHVSTEYFTPTESGEFYFGVHSTTQDVLGPFLVFDVLVEEAPVNCDEAETVPYEETFATEPICWTFENADNTTPEWSYLTSIDFDGDNVDDPFLAAFPQHVNHVEKDDWAFSKKVQLTEGTAYIVSIDYNAINLGNNSAIEKFDLLMTDSNSSSATFSEVIGTYDNVSQQGIFPGSNGNDVLANAYKSQVAFVAPSTGEFHIAIHALGTDSSFAGGLAVFRTAIEEGVLADCEEASETPYSEDFSEGEPNCWAYEDMDSQAPVWAYSEEDLDGDGNGNPMMLITSEEATQTEKDDWVFTNKIQLEAGFQYKIELAYNALNLNGMTSNESFEIGITDEPTGSAALLQVLSTEQDVQQQGTIGNTSGNDPETMAQNVILYYEPDTSGEYFIGVHATTAGNAGALALFDVSVEKYTEPSGGEVYIYDELSFSSVDENGDTVGGHNSASGNSVIWNEGMGAYSIGGLAPGDGTGGEVSISNDGLTMAGPYLNPENNLKEFAMYDVTTDTWTILGGIGGVNNGQTSSAWDISGDGKTVVGLGWLPVSGAHAIKWTEEEGVVDLGSTVDGVSSRVEAVNNDGSIIVGWQDTAVGFRQGAIWVDGVQELITFPNGDPVSTVGTISDDGVWIGGEGNYANNFQAWIRSESTGVITLGPPLSPGWRGATTGLSADGAIATGFYRPQGPAVFGQGFIWTEELGVTNLNEYAEYLGIDTQGVTFSLPLDISADGSTIVGIGRNADNFSVGFILKLRPTKLSTTDVETQQVITYYPNPVKDILHIQSDKNVEQVSVYNLAGQQVVTNAKLVDGKLNLRTLTSGIYVIRVLMENGKMETFKIIKK